MALVNRNVDVLPQINERMKNATSFSQLFYWMRQKEQVTRSIQADAEEINRLAFESYIPFPRISN